MTATVLSVVALVGLVAMVVAAEWRARRRVRSARASDAAPEWVPYATFHTEGDGR